MYSLWVIVSYKLKAMEACCIYTHWGMPLKSQNVTGEMWVYCDNMYNLWVIYLNQYIKINQFL